MLITGRQAQARFKQTFEGPRADQRLRRRNRRRKEAIPIKTGTLGADSGMRRLQRLRAFQRPVEFDAFRRRQQFDRQNVCRIGVHLLQAALASENKSLAHPASVDSLPTSANQEDFVSMATFAARRLQQMNANTANILAVELLAAAEGIEFHRPLKSSKALETAHAAIRSKSPRFDRDRFFAPSIAATQTLVRARAFEGLLEPGLRLPSSD